MAPKSEKKQEALKISYCGYWFISNEVFITPASCCTGNRQG